MAAPDHKRKGSEPNPPASTGSALGTAFAAWLVPGLGHLLLGKRGRALLFFVIVLSALVIGSALDGNLYHVLPRRPLTLLGTFASMGTGLPYFVLRFGFGYEGDVAAVGYEYGTAFMLTAGLMNLLLVLDCWDIARGVKE